MLGAWWSLEHICSGGVKRPQEAHELGVDEKREERIGGEKKKEGSVDSGGEDSVGVGA